MTDWGLAPGTRDYAFGEAAWLREKENGLLELFDRWGYREIVTSTLESLETLGVGAGAQDCWKLFDANGSILALRPEMTVPAARFAAGNLKGIGPWRLSYAAPVYRFRGAKREGRQVGVELFGLGGPAGDAEVVGLAVEALRTLGAGDFRIHLGHWAFLDGIFAAAAVPGWLREKLREALAQRNLVRYGELVMNEAGLGASGRELLERVPFWHGGSELFLQLPPPAAEESSQALEELREVFAVLEGQGITEVRLDLGLVRDFAYYTGLVFEAYVPGLGRPLLGGGRYDHLCARWGRDWTAIGFAIALDDYLEALESGGLGSKEKEELVLVPVAGGEREAYVLAGGLRNRGKRVTVWPRPDDLAGAGEYAAGRTAKVMGLGG